MSRGIRYVLIGTALLSIAVYLCALRFSDLQIDEREALQTGWKMASGEWLYVDFFQHHNPLLYSMLAPLAKVFDQSLNYIWAGRGLVGICGLAVLWFLWLVTRKLENAKAAWVAVALTATSPLFLRVGADIRPDVLQVALCMAAIYINLLHRWDPRLRTTLLGAFLLGLAFVALQKAVFVILALCAIWLARAWQKLVPWRDVFLWGGMLASVALSPVLLWAVQGEFTKYFELNFLLNGLPSQTEVDKTVIFERIQGGSWKLGILAVGLVWLVPIWRESREHRELILITVVVALGSLGHHVQFAQYYLMLLPLAVFFSAVAIVSVSRLHELMTPVCLVVICALGAYLGLPWTSSTELDEQLRRIEFTLNSTDHGAVVYDPSMRYSLFRSSPHYFWFSVQPGAQLDKLRRLHEVDYSRNQVVCDVRPELVYGHFAALLEDAASGNPLYLPVSGQNRLYRLSKSAVKDGGCVETST